MSAIIRMGRTACMALAMAVAAGCADSTGSDSTRPDTNVTGAWSGNAGGMTLSIGVTETDGRFSGFGTFTVDRTSIPVTVHGGRNGMSVALMLRSEGYEAAAFTGTLVNATTIQGTLNQSGFQNTPATLYKKRQ